MGACKKCAPQKQGCTWMPGKVKGDSASVPFGKYLITNSTLLIPIEEWIFADVAAFERIRWRRAVFDVFVRYCA
jgi:hypothetical protein